MAETSGTPVPEKGLVKHCTVTNRISPTQFDTDALQGMGENYFAGWTVYVDRLNSAGLVAPQGEQTLCSAFVNSTGRVTHAAFTAVVSVGDEILMIHPNLGLSLALLIAAITPRRVQNGTQATTAALTTIGANIISTSPFKVSGLLSLHNMQVGDTFLVTEEIRDQDDVTWREYARNSYIGVMTSPMVWFQSKVCQGWRVRIQRTAGVDRDVTYQFFTGG